MYCYNCCANVSSLLFPVCLVANGRRPRATMYISSINFHSSSLCITNNSFISISIILFFIFPPTFRARNDCLSWSWSRTCISLCEGTFSLLLWDVWPEYPSECAFFHSNRSILHYVFNTSYPTECCFLSFKSIHPSLCIQHILPYCVCGMRTAEGRSMLLDLLSFIRFNHQYAFMTSYLSVAGAAVRMLLNVLLFK